MEEWRKITGFNYYVSSNGEIRNKDGIHLKPSIFKNGYKAVHLYLNGKEKTCYIHRLVAQEFIENPENKPQIDHKNRNRTDNRVVNLRWVSQSENMQNTGVFTTNKLQEKHICKCSDRESFMLTITKDGKRFRKRFKTLNEAIEFRDEMLNV